GTVKLALRRLGGLSREGHERRRSHGQQTRQGNMDGPAPPATPQIFSLGFEGCSCDRHKASFCLPERGEGRAGIQEGRKWRQAAEGAFDGKTGCPWGTPMHEGQVAEPRPTPDLKLGRILREVV